MIILYVSGRKKNGGEHEIDLAYYLNNSIKG